MTNFTHVWKQTAWSGTIWFQTSPLHPRCACKISWQLKDCFRCGKNGWYCTHRPKQSIWYNQSYTPPKLTKCLWCTRCRIGSLTTWRRGNRDRLEPCHERDSTSVDSRASSLRAWCLWMIYHLLLESAQWTICRRHYNICQQWRPIFGGKTSGGRPRSSCYMDQQ